MAKKAQAGKKATGSDCWIHIEATESGGIQIELKSKVQSMYGESIKDTATKMMEFFGIENAILSIEDSGSLPFVLTARIEAAIKNCYSQKKEEYLAPIIPQNRYKVARDRFRRSRLYVPGDQPRLIINAGLYKPDCIILDLEDAVAPTEKESTRFMVRNALREVDFVGIERMIRINQLPMAMTDLEYIVPHGVHTVLVPKCENADTIREIDAHIQSLRNQHEIRDDIFLLPIIESALGAINAFEIASASPYIVALSIGLEDFTADLGIERTLEGKETSVAQQQVVLAARAAGIQPIGSVFSDIADEEGLRKNVNDAKSLGFEGIGCIHPGQIRIVHETMAPKDSEIERAKKISLALEEAQKKGTGVVSLGTKMIDAPVVKRAERILKLAIQNNQIPANWKEELENER
jgi:citrate lyase subunit beta/citryl-CoA lyase